ncbi:hypothetical protein L6452_20238 [Arctium lappa]|uniref:Uncharacterized protein n=1 Tax=Arctium lappa TaxID=4217 RepID=A0ACB9BC28_ARCLA|nr:hypothetical protein L6452_20238 [Arctium lappa]
MVGKNNRSKENGAGATYVNKESEEPENIPEKIIDGKQAAGISSEDSTPMTGVEETQKHNDDFLEVEVPSLMKNEAATGPRGTLGHKVSESQSKNNQCRPEFSQPILVEESTQDTACPRGGIGSLDQDGNTATREEISGVRRKSSKASNGESSKLKKKFFHSTGVRLPSTISKKWQGKTTT